MLYIFLILVVIITIIYFNSKKDNQKFSENEYILNNIENFNVSDSYISTNGLSIGLDSESNSICFVDFNANTYVYKYSDIIECSIEIDGETTQRKSTSNTALRAIAGGVLFGGTGALVGGLSGNIINKEKIFSVNLKVIVNDLKNPVHKINFMMCECDKKSIIYIAANSNVEKWHAIISILINKNSDIIAN